jgi:hypothetical protein
MFSHYFRGGIPLIPYEHAQGNSYYAMVTVYRTGTLEKYTISLPRQNINSAAT